MRVFDRLYRDGLAAAAEALYPHDPGGAPDAAMVDLPGLVHANVLLLPPSQGFLLKLLFVAVELLTPFLSPWPARFSRRSASERLRIVRAWRASRLYPVRLLGNAVRATLQMSYLAHPAVLRAIGEYKTVPYAHDAFDVDIRQRTGSTVA